MVLALVLVFETKIHTTTALKRIILLLIKKRDYLIVRVMIFRKEYELSHKYFWQKAG
jgi:hypothetical protein